MWLEPGAGPALQGRHQGPASLSQALPFCFQVHKLLAAAGDTESRSSCAMQLRLPCMSAQAAASASSGFTGSHWWHHKTERCTTLLRPGQCSAAGLTAASCAASRLGVSVLVAAPLGTKLLNFAQASQQQCSQLPTSQRLALIRVTTMPPELLGH